MSQSVDTPKIHVEVRDLDALYGRLKDELSSLIDEEMGSSGNARERKKLRRLILGRFLDRLFNSIKYSLSIDDISSESWYEREVNIVKEMKKQKRKEDKIEPYDFALNDKVRELYAQVEDKVSEVTAMRRNRPKLAYEQERARLDQNELYIDEKLKDDSDMRDKVIPMIEQTTGDEGSDTNEFQDRYKQMLVEIAQLKGKTSDTVSDLDNMISVVKFLNEHDTV